MTTRNVPENVHRASRALADQHHCGPEAEIRAILESAAKPQDRLRIGDAIVAVAHACDVTTEDVESLESHLTT